MARKISNLSASYTRLWLNFIHFSGYKYKIRLVSTLRKREDKALISMSTILKFSARSNKYIGSHEITSLYTIILQPGIPNS